MPIECEHLREEKLEMNLCNRCYQSFDTYFMRGQVQSFWRRILGMKYCAVICPECKEIIAWEKTEVKGKT